ncbi:MAG TPA: exodeoxyribonuclease VII large subunit [Bacillota bacterium]|jgi:exodeoxyribonuclease VII large subunit
MSLPIPEAPVLTVRDLTSRIKSLIEGAPWLRSVLVRGEVSNFKLYPSGHAYFTLKDRAVEGDQPYSTRDETCQIKCVMFRRWVEKLPYHPQNGMQVIAGGAVGVYERDGSYQLYVELLQPDGLGGLHQAFEDLKKKLAAEGFFDVARKRPIPFLPMRVAVVTSPAAAALRDIIKVAGKRFPNAWLTVVPTQVQGGQAPPEIIRAIRLANLLPEVEVIILARGGGSLEELWAFNDEGVARAIYDSARPVVTGIGHETDMTIADFVADKRAATPSNAAEMVFPDQRELDSRLRILRSHLRSGLRAHLEAKRRVLERLSQRSVLRRPQDRLARAREDLTRQVRLMVQTARHVLDYKRADRDHVVARLDALSPLATLARGYSITRTWPDGRVVRDSRELAVAGLVEVILHRGEIVCRVEETRDGGEREAGPARPAKPGGSYDLWAYAEPVEGEEGPR